MPFDWTCEYKRKCLSYNILEFIFHFCYGSWFMALEKVFLEAARKLLEFTPASSHLRTGAAHSATEGASLAAPAPSVVQGQRPGVQGEKPPEIF